MGKKGEPAVLVIFLVLLLYSCAPKLTGYAVADAPSTFVTQVNTTLMIDLTAYFSENSTFTSDAGTIDDTVLTYIPTSVGEQYIVATSSTGESVLFTINVVDESSLNKTSQNPETTSPAISRETADERETFDRGITGDLGECTTVNASSTLTTDISASGDCIIIATSNTVFDCNGHRITWDTGGGGSDVAIRAENATSVTIKNCVIVDGNSGGGTGIGMRLSNLNHSIVTNNTIQTNGTSSNTGIIINSVSSSYSDNLTIANNTIKTWGSAGSNIGIGGSVTIPNMTVTGNFIYSDGTTSGNDGISFNFNVDNVSSFRIADNYIRTNGTTSQRGIIAAVYNSTIVNNTFLINGTAGIIGIQPSGNVHYGAYISNNTIQLKGTTGGFGIAIGSSNVTISGNQIDINSTTTSNTGIGFASAGVKNNTISHNNITVNGTSANKGFVVGASSNLFNNNTIWTNLNLSLNDGMSVSGQNNTFTNNTFITGGANSSHGILVTGHNNSFVNNTITARGNSSFGISISLGGSDNNFTGNVINATDWINITVSTSTNNFTNTTFLSDNGSIRFNGTITLTGAISINQTSINVTSNTAFVNSTNLGLFNTTAQITFQGLNFTDPRPLFSGNDDGAYINCSSLNCTEHSYSGGVYVFNVTSFSTYSSEESCPTTIAANTTLSTDLNAAASCISFTSNNIVLDCNGHVISWDTGAGNSASAVLVENMSNITVKNCVLRDLSVHSNRSIGINLTNTNLSTLLNNTIQTNGTTHNYGIILQNNSNNNTVTNNTIRTNGTTDNYGIHILISSHNNTLFNNTITTNGTGQNDAIRIDTNSNNNTVVNNTLATVSSSSYAVFILSSSDNVFVNTTLNATTDWIFANAQTTNNFTNTTFQNANGSIRYNGTIVINALTNITQNKTNITNNKAYVNTTNLTALNTTAQITLNTITWTDPRIIADYDTGAYQNCSLVQCVQHSYTGGVFIFNVTRFTSYSTMEAGLNISLLNNDTLDPTNISNNQTTINYTITINVSEGNATNITLRNYLPPYTTLATSQPANTSNNTWTVGNLTNASFIVNITVSVNTSIPDNTLLNNTANITYQNITGHTNSVQNTQNTTVYNSFLTPNITLTKTESADPVTAGSTLTYTINVANNGNGTSYNTTVVEIYPSEITFVSSQPEAVSGSANANFSIGNFTNGTTFVINITTTAATAGTASNNATAIYANASGVQANTSVTESTTIEAASSGSSGTGGGGASSSVSSAGQAAATTNTAQGQAATSVATLTQTAETYSLRQAQSVSVNINNEQHTVSVLSINEDQVTIKVESTPQRATLKKGESREFNVAEDYHNDLRVTVVNIEDGVADILITKIEQPIEISIGRPQKQQARHVMTDSAPINAIYESLPGKQMPQEIPSPKKLFAAAVLFIAIATVFTILILRRPIPSHKMFAPPRHVEPRRPPRSSLANTPRSSFANPPYKRG